MCLGPMVFFFGVLVVAAAAGVPVSAPRLQAPAPALKSNARAASLLGTVGSTTTSGTDVYKSSISFPIGTGIAGPFEAGFDAEIDILLGWLGCSPASKGYLAGGIDTQTSSDILAQSCGVALPRVAGNGDYISLMWSCGAHSPPNSAKCTSPPGSLTGYAACTSPAYHFHQNFTCLYNVAASGHSSKVGATSPGNSDASVTAKNIYGKYESTGTLPSDLDACNGHFGVTPDSSGASVYHHHVTDKPPFAVGCYGPNAAGGLVTLAQCRSYYSTCGDGDTVTVTTAAGSFSYDKWCPCFDKTNNYLNTGNSTTPTQAASLAAPQSWLLSAVLLVAAMVAAAN